MKFRIRSANPESGQLRRSLIEEVTRRQLGSRLCADKVQGDGAKPRLFARLERAGFAVIFKDMRHRMTCRRNVYPQIPTG